MSAVATSALFIFVGIFAILTVVLIGVIAFALTKVVKILDSVTNKLDPVIVKATETIETLQRVTSNIGEKSDQILTRGEAMTETVSGRVERTADVVQQAVTGPLINLSSLIAGLSKGVSAYSQSAENNNHHK